MGLYAERIRRRETAKKSVTDTWNHNPKSEIRNPRGGRRNWVEKDISGCGLAGLISRSGRLISGDVIVQSIVLQHDRGNGLGGGFAAYGIYPDYRDCYALHIMYDDEDARERTEPFIRERFTIKQHGGIPPRRVPRLGRRPIFYVYFVLPRPSSTEAENIAIEEAAQDDFVAQAAIRINTQFEGAYVISSGKNMGVFKGVGFPEDIAELFRLDEYKAYLWTAHNRFPTNTPGWWGGAHPFSLLNWSVVHNGELSSYGINRRYLEMYGYQCTLQTDTEVIAYLLDLLVRRNRLPLRLACYVLAPSLWKTIDTLPEEEQRICTALRMTYGSALLNGPFSILVSYGRGLMGFNDRIKLRPLVVAEHGDMVYMASEKAAITEICPQPDRMWAPKAGEPVIAELDEGVLE